MMIVWRLNLSDPAGFIAFVRRSINLVTVSKRAIF